MGYLNLPELSSSQLYLELLLQGITVKPLFIKTFCTVHSKNSGMNFIPIEYDFHPNEFHTYGMNSASMTFIPTAVRSSYRECEKTSVIPKLRVNFTPRCLRWRTALLGQRSSKSVDEKSIYAQKKIYSACMMQQ